MKLYSPPNRSYPQELPNRWKFEDGTVRTDLQTLTDAELEELGWHGPITMPQDIQGTSYFTHNYFWNPNALAFDYEEISEYDKQKRVDYKEFWDLLINGSATESTNENEVSVLIDENGNQLSMNMSDIVYPYQKIKDTAKVSLEANVLVTEFIALISDAKIGNANIKKIQKVLLEILSTISFTTEELAEIQNIFTKSGMFAVYTLT